MNKYTVFYRKSPYKLGRYGEEFIADNYIPVMTLYEETLDDVYYQMQGENWSPNGEAREAIEKLGLSHTSMSIGDVIYSHAKNKYYMVDAVGFTEISSDGFSLDEISR